MITFVDYLYKGIGGVGQIVVNTTLELNRRSERAKLYCSSESYEYQRLKESKADFEFIDSDIVSIKELGALLASNDVIVLTSINDSPLLENIKYKNNKIVFYSVHPDTFFCYEPKMKYFCNQRKAALQLVETLSYHNGLYFMDWPNVKGVYDRGGKPLNVIKYLPVPVMSYTNKHRNRRPLGSTNITYLGRGNEKWKVFPVVKILEDLNNIDNEVTLTIITDDNSLFQKMISEYIPYNVVEVEFINNLYGENLEYYLLKHSTLHISMGTSALEGAKLGIPTILIDCSEQKFPGGYLYRWLYECKDYCLAGIILNGILPYSIGRSLHSAISSISSDDGYRKESEACRSYLEENHSIQSFVDNLESACEQTKMTSKEYCKTRFSKNMYYIKPIIIYLAKVKHILLRLLGLRNYYLRTHGI